MLAGASSLFYHIKDVRRNKQNNSIKSYVKDRCQYRKKGKCMCVCNGQIIGLWWFTYLSQPVGKPTICIGENKGQISFAVTAKLISAFVFAPRIVQFLFYLNPKFQLSSSFLCLYRAVCVVPVRKPHCWFSHKVAHLLIMFPGSWFLSIMLIEKWSQWLSSNAMHQTRQTLIPFEHLWITTSNILICKCLNA